MNKYNKTEYTVQHDGLTYKSAQHPTHKQSLPSVQQTQVTHYGSNTQWVTFRDARFENINANITALREVTPCSLINKYQRLEQSAASIFRKLDEGREFRDKVSTQETKARQIPSAVIKKSCPHMLHSILSLAMEVSG
jgi:hypothetical protein